MDLVVEAALWLNRRFPRRSLERRESDAAYALWEWETGRRVFEKQFGRGRLEGRTVLDAACGPGGKTAWYAETGAKRVIGVDLDPAYLARAASFSAARGVQGRTRFVAADAGRLPLRDASIDAVTANDAVEHFSDPAAVLSELARVTRPGGRLFVTFPPFWSANGAHLYDYVRVPWCQVFLSRPRLGRVVERAVLEAERPAGEERARAIAAEQLAFYDHALNRMTVSRFLAMVAAERRLRLVRFRCEPPRLAWLRPVAALPGVRELLAAMVAAELERV